MISYLRHKPTAEVLYICTRYRLSERRVFFFLYIRAKFLIIYKLKQIYSPVSKLQAKHDANMEYLLSNNWIRSVGTYHRINCKPYVTIDSILIIVNNLVHFSYWNVPKLARWHIICSTKKRAVSHTTDCGLDIQQSKPIAKINSNPKNQT